MSVCDGIHTRRLLTKTTRVLSPEDVLKIKDLGHARLFSCCAARRRRIRFPPEKEAPNSKPALVVLTAFLAPSKAIAFGHTPLRWGWQDENLILGELGLGRTRGEMKAGSSAIAANLVVGAGSRRVYSIIPRP